MKNYNNKMASNNKSNENMVDTVSGKKIDRKLCIRIGNEFYEKNVDCFNIDDSWYRKGNPKIYFNSIEDRWMKITENTVQGIVGVKENGSYLTGSFEMSFENSYMLHTKNGQMYVSGRDLFQSIKKVYDTSAGRYMDTAAATQCGFNPSEHGKGNNYPYSFERLYNSESLIPRFAAIDHNKYNQNLLSRVNRSDKSFPLFSKYSFGLEFETSGGIIPEHRCKELGLIPLRDGSISGHEYTTIPMRGEDGINLLMNQMAELKERCVINKECSVHVHFGNFPLNEKLILNLYNISFALQNELGNMFPAYIYNTAKYKKAGKDYCKRLPQRFDSISSLYYFLAEQRAEWNGRFTNQHPQDPNRDRKWENHQRYYWINFINLLFGSNAKTVEFRIHTPTFNSSKIINWLFICTAILNYAEKFDGKIDFKNLSLNDIIMFSYDERTAGTVNSYIATRKIFFEECLNVHSDTYGVVDLIQDGDTQFDTPYAAR